MFQGFEEISVRAGDAIVRRRCRRLFVIKEGTALCSHLDDAESVVAYLVRGDCFMRTRCCQHHPQRHGADDAAA